MTVFQTAAVDNFAGFVMIFFIFTGVISGGATIMILADSYSEFEKGWAALTVFLFCVSLAFVIADGVIMHGGFMGSS